MQQGSVQALLAAAAATRNSMCGLYPLAVAMEALYGHSTAAAASPRTGGEPFATTDGASSISRRVRCKPQLLVYQPAHLIFKRPDSTGFAAFAVFDEPQL